MHQSVVSGFDKADGSSMYGAVGKQCGHGKAQQFSLHAQCKHHSSNSQQ